MRGYALCGEPRSGTTFLKQAMQSTGKLGHPQEWFHASRVAEHTGGGEFIDAMLARTASPNGVYGLKIFSAHARVAVKAHWATRLPNLAFVHVTRPDLLDQAISLARAAQTARFESGEAERKPGSYDRALITTKLKDLARGQARWSVWFATHGIRPLAITYDEIMGEPQMVVDRIAALVGVEDAPIDWTKVATEIMRDEQSAEWKRRYLAEAGSPDAIDELEDRSPMGIARMVRRVLIRP